MSLEIKVDEHGRLVKVKGPVMWTMNTGQGWIANLDKESYDEWAVSMINRGAIINGFLPNLTTVLTIMENLYCASKDALRKATQGHYAKKIKVNSKATTKKKPRLPEGSNWQVGHQTGACQDKICCQS